MATLPFTEEKKVNGLRWIWRCGWSPLRAMQLKTPRLPQYYQYRAADRETSKFVCFSRTSGNRDRRIHTGVRTAWRKVQVQLSKPAALIPDFLPAKITHWTTRIEAKRLKREQQGEFLSHSRKTPSDPSKGRRDHCFVMIRLRLWWVQWRYFRCMRNHHSYYSLAINPSRSKLDVHDSILRQNYMRQEWMCVASTQMKRYVPLSLVHCVSGTGWTTVQ